MVRDSDFNFTVTLSDDSVNGEYGEMEFADGVTSFTLKDGESKTATGLEPGITYTVEETNANTDYYEIEKESQTGEIIGGNVAKAYFENIREYATVDITVSSQQKWKPGSTAVYKLFFTKNPNIPYETAALKDFDGSTINGHKFVNGICELELPIGETTSLHVLPGNITILRDSYSFLPADNASYLANISKGETKEVTKEYSYAKYNLYLFKSRSPYVSERQYFKICIDVNTPEENMLLEDYTCNTLWGDVNFTSDDNNHVEVSLPANAGNNNTYYYPVPAGSQVTIYEDADDAVGYDVTYSLDSINNIDKTYQVTVTNTVAASQASLSKKARSTNIPDSLTFVIGEESDIDALDSTDSED